MRLLNQILINRYGEFNMWSNSIGICYRGSIAHGTFLPGSNPNGIDDKDVFGVYIQPKEYFFGLRDYEQFERFVEYWDVLLYDFRKFIRLLIKSNPNTMQFLWTPEHHFIHKTPILQKLIENRELFLSQNIYHSFCGYSHGQLKKMEHMAYKGYMGEKRKALVAKYGYDTKNAQHLIRLLRQGIECLEQGTIIVERPDRAELIQIKQGAWSIEKVKREANELFKRLEEAKVNTKLPARPDTEAIDKLCQEILFEHYMK